MASVIKSNILCIFLFSIFLVSCNGLNDQTEDTDVSIDQLYNDLEAIQDELFPKMELFEEHITNTDRDELIRFFSKGRKNFTEFITLIGMENAKYHDLIQLIEDHDIITYKIKEVSGVSETELIAKSMKEISNYHSDSNFDLKTQVTTYLNHLEKRKTYSCSDNQNSSQIIYAKNNFEMMNEDEEGPETQVHDEASFWASECSWQASACTIVAAGASTGCKMFAPLCFGAGAALCFCEFCSGNWVDENC